MSKYYKKPNKYSWRSPKDKVSYPNHKYSFIHFRHKNRKTKKFNYFECRQEELFERLWPEIIVSKVYHTTFDGEDYEEFINKSKPRWRQIMNQKYYTDQK